MVKYDLDATAQAISSPARRAALERLAEGPASMSQLADLLEVSLPAVDKHVNLLLAAGLVTKAKHGRVTTLELRPGGLNELAEWALRTRLWWTGALDRFADHVESPPDEQEHR